MQDYDQIVADEQNMLDEFYDENEEKENRKFEEFLKNRTPPALPEKIEDLLTKQERLKQEKEKNNGKEVKKFKIDKDKKNIKEFRGNEYLSKNNIIKLLKEQSKNIAKQTEAIKNKNDYYPDWEYIEKNKKFFAKFLNYSVEFDRDMNIEKIMRSWTNYRYSPYNDLKTNYIKHVGERVVIIEELSKIFNHSFFTYINAKNYRFDSLNFEIAKFIGDIDKKDKMPTVFEYKFIKSMLGKIVICMLSNVDRCFIADSAQINARFKNAVQTHVKEFSHILKTRDRISYSWEVFENFLFLSGFDNQIYKYNGYDDLKQRLKECYEDDENFLMEQLAANTLKTLIPTIAFSYFSVIKNIYLIGRLISIYVNKQLYKNKELLNIKKDLYIIVAALVIEYEVNYVANINVRCAPGCKDGTELTKQTEMYYINHLIAGPQYCLLKQLELTFPTLAETF